MHVSHGIGSGITTSHILQLNQLYKALMDGWNRGDARAFAAAFAVDGDLVGFDGHLLRGRRAIEEFHAPLFTKWLKGTELVGHVESVRLLSDSVAVIHAVGGTIVNGGDSPAPERNSIQTITAVLEGTSWQIAAFQNTRCRPMSARRANTVLWLLGDFVWKLFGHCGTDWAPRLPRWMSGKAD